MTETAKKWIFSNPPHRLVPESSRHIMLVTAVTLLVPALAACVFFGYHALKIILIASFAAVLAEVVASALKHERVSGSISHSFAMGLIFAFTLPPTCPWYIVWIGSVSGILIGKHLFGGLGHYLWHPALVGRLVVQLFFKSQLTSEAGPLLLRGKMFLGNIQNITHVSDWFNFNWFGGSGHSEGVGFILPQPLEFLRNFQDLQFLDSVPQLQQYLLDKLPSLSHCIIGATPGGLGETSAVACILVALYLFYRGYLNWQQPVVFLVAAYLAALLLPIRVEHPDITSHTVYWPIIAENIAAGFTLANFHLFTGSLLFSACIISTDMTSRPITIRGQVIFAAGAGLLAMIFRLYTPIAIPSYAAILALNSFIPTIDRYTRPYSRRGLY